MLAVLVLALVVVCGGRPVVLVLVVVAVRWLCEGFAFVVFFLVRAFETVERLAFLRCGRRAILNSFETKLQGFLKAFGIALGGWRFAFGFLKGREERNEVSNI